MGEISSNNAKIQRLENAKSKIIGDQSELGSHQHLLDEPDLTSETWSGNAAREFEEIRSEIGEDFRAILTVQSETLIDNITEEIIRLKRKNSSLSG